MARGWQQVPAPDQPPWLGLDVQDGDWWVVVALPAEWWNGHGVRIARLRGPTTDLMARTILGEIRAALAKAPGGDVRRVLRRWASSGSEAEEALRCRP